ncbi:MAG: TetR/AcrR family transcriptional regulator [Steroidobacteraceae bacterium]
MNYIADRRLEEKDRRRNDILDAAESVASEAGIDRLTMEQVARKARLSRALIYVYFKDKTDLHFGLCERGIAILITRFEESVARHHSGAEQLAAMGRAYVAFSQEFPVYFEALSRFQAQDTDTPEAAGFVRMCMQRSARTHEIMTESIARGIQDGSIDRDIGVPAAVAMTLWGFMHGIIQLSTTKAAILGEYQVTPMGLVEEALRLIRRGLRPVN